jgi:hypothetical protein
MAKLLGASKGGLEDMIKAMSTVMPSHGNEVRLLQMLPLGNNGDAMDALVMTMALEIKEPPRRGLKVVVEITPIILMALIMGVVQEPRLGINNLHHHLLDKLVMGTADTLHIPPLQRTWLLALVFHRLHPAWAPCTMALAVLHLHLPVKVHLLYVRSFNIGDSMLIRCSHQVTSHRHRLPCDYNKSPREHL